MRSCRVRRYAITAKNSRAREIFAVRHRRRGRFQTSIAPNSSGPDEHFSVSPVPAIPKTVNDDNVRPVAAVRDNGHSPRLPLRPRPRSNGYRGCCFGERCFDKISGRRLRGVRMSDAVARRRRSSSAFGHAVDQRRECFVTIIGRVYLFGKRSTGLLYFGRTRFDDNSKTSFYGYDSRCYSDIFARVYTAIVKFNNNPNVSTSNFYRQLVLGKLLGSGVPTGFENKTSPEYF